MTLWSEQYAFLSAEEGSGKEGSQTANASAEESETMKEAQRVLNTYVRFMVETGEQLDIKQGIANSKVGELMGEPNRNFIHAQRTSRPATRPSKFNFPFLLFHFQFSHHQDLNYHNFNKHAEIQ